VDYFHQTLIHAAIGGFGGLLYVLRQHLKAYNVRRLEYFARPVFGAASATLFNIALGFPNHNVLFCAFVGYFGVDVWDLAAERFQGRLPLAGKHEPKQRQP